MNVILSPLQITQIIQFKIFYSPAFILKILRLKFAGWFRRTGQYFGSWQLLVIVRKKSSHEYVSQFWMVTKMKVFESTNRKAVWMVTKKQKLLHATYIFIFTSIQCMNDKFVTVHNKCLKIPLSTSMHLATSTLRSWAVCMNWSSLFFILAAAPKAQVSNSSCVSTFQLWTSPYIQIHKQKSPRDSPGDLNSYEVFPCFFLSCKANARV